MASWRRALLFGFVIWLVPFLVAVSAFTIRDSWRSLFESIMAVAVAFVAVVCALLYFQIVKKDFYREGVRVGLLWWAISVVVDLPLMLTSTMNYTVAEYFADIGLTYLMIPIITLGIAIAMKGTSDEVEAEGSKAKRGPAQVLRRASHEM